MKLVVTMVWAVATFFGTCACVSGVNEVKWEFIRELSRNSSSLGGCSLHDLGLPLRALPGAIFNSALCLWLGVRGILPGTGRKASAGYGSSTFIVFNSPCLPRELMAHFRC